MAYKQKVQKVMVQPINLIFRYLQNRSRVSIWVYEQVNLRIEGHIVGFDEYMNLVLDDAEEVHLKRNSRKPLGRIMLKGDNITDTTVGLFMELHPILESGDIPNDKLWYVLSAPYAPCCRVGQACVATDDYKVFIIGGADPSTAYSDLYRFNCAQHSWSKVSHSKYDARYEHCAFIPTCDQGHIYLFGGATKNNNLNTIQTMNRETGNVETMQCAGQCPTPRTLHSAASSGNCLYVWSGGHQGSNPVPDLSLHIFNAEKKSWEQPKLHGKLPNARHGHAMVMNGDYVYIHGGMSGPTFHKDLHKINVKHFTCLKLQANGDVPSARAAHSAVSYEDQVFIFGGLSLEGALDDMYQLDTESLTWTKLKFDCAPPAPRLDHSMIVTHLPIVKKTPRDLPTQSAETNGTAQVSTSNGESSSSRPQIVALDDWYSSISDEVQEAGDRLESVTISDDKIDGTVPVCLIFGGMDTSGNLFNDLLVLRLGD